MADVSKINVKGVDYTIKDDTARTSVNGLTTRVTTAEGKVANAEKTLATTQQQVSGLNTKVEQINGKLITVEYVESTQTIKIT